MLDTVKVLVTLLTGHNLCGTPAAICGMMR